MKIDKSTINDACSELLGAAYQLAAQDELRNAFVVIRGSREYKEKLAQASHIKNRQDYNAFLAGLSNTDELARTAVEYFADEWNTKIIPRLEMVEKRKQLGLENAEPNYNTCLQEIEIWAQLMLGFDITAHRKYPKKELDTHKEFEKYKKHVKQRVAKRLEKIASEHLESRADGKRIISGDIVTLKQIRGLEAFVRDENDVFSIEGKTVPLKFGEPSSLAEFLYEIEFYDNKRKGFVKGALLKVLADKEPLNKGLVTVNAHFEDIEGVVSNAYKEMVTQIGAESAAAIMIDEIIAKCLEKEKEGIKGWYKMPYDYHVNSFAYKHKLTSEQLDAIREGKPTNYKFPAFRRVTVLKHMFSLLAHLASRSIGYKLHQNLKQPEYVVDVVDERYFKRYISKIIRETARNMAESTEYLREDESSGKEEYSEKEESLEEDNVSKAYALVKTQLSIAAQVLTRENKQVTWLYQNQFKDYRSPMLPHTSARITDSTKIIGGKIIGDFSIDRAVMYLDTSIYQEDPFSPPSENRMKSIKLSVSDGCKYGRCTYCTAYKHQKSIGVKRFNAKSPKEFEEHCLSVREMLPEFGIGLVDRLFLGSGDIFGFPTSQILEYINIARKVFEGYEFVGDSSRECISEGVSKPKLYNPIHIKQISGFARTNSIANKSVEELREIIGCGLNTIFLGIETGSDKVLQYVMKSSSYHNMEIAAEKLLRTDMNVSVMIMPGIGGLKYYEDHVVKTADILNKIVPHYIAFLAINPNPASAYAPKMEEEVSRGENMPLTDEMIVEQIYDIMRMLNPERWVKYGRTCVISAPLKPADKVAKNPLGLAFKINSEEERMNYQTALANTFHGFFHISLDFMPSALIPNGEFNRDSSIRGMAYKI
ncbi:radical SAM protein [Candidatus Woesearchaeota archaeon]|nr:radical SAM protein [Candidatus Woesearchaeota archaeon]